MIPSMPVYQLGDHVAFPPADHADDNGLLAVGGDLSIERLLLAYEQGIFPWYEENLPILWHSPDPRMVLRTREFKINRSLRKSIKKAPYQITIDTSFNRVIYSCAKRHRPGQDGTWITSEMIEAYCELHRQGYAHSVEAWNDTQLVGGVYGVSLGAAFFGESMFATQSDASKIAFACLVTQLRQWNFNFVDCQVHTVHLENFGATEWSRGEFLNQLKISNQIPTKRGPWHFEINPHAIDFSDMNA